MLIMEDSYPNFLPQWTKALEHIYSEKYFGLISKHMTNADRQNRVSKKHGLDWSYVNNCLVGEAYFNRYTDHNRCSGCNTYSMTSLSVFNSIEELYEFKKVLAEHLQEAHPDIWSEWKNRF